MILIQHSVNSDWQFQTQSRVQQTDRLILENNEKATSNINIPYLATTTTHFSVGVALIYWFSPVFRTEASVLAVPWYQLWYLSSGSYFLIPRFLYRFSRNNLHFFHFGTIPVPNQVESKA